MENIMHTQTQLDNMSVVEKATLLNQLRIQSDPKVKKEEKPISELFDGYGPSNNMFVDRDMWNIYGIPWKEYYERLASFLTYDVFKLEEAIDKRIVRIELANSKKDG